MGFDTFLASGGALSMSEASSPVRLFQLPGGVRCNPVVDAWFDTQARDLAALACQWLEAMRQCGPEVVDLLHDGQPTACVGDVALGYVAVYRAHVNVGFFLGATLADPDRLLQGTGRFMRHVKLLPGQSDGGEALQRLIRSAYDDLKARLVSASG
jgi:hypothetical protein